MGKYIPQPTLKPFMRSLVPFLIMRYGMLVSAKTHSTVVAVPTLFCIYSVLLVVCCPLVIQVYRRTHPKFGEVKTDVICILGKNDLKKFVKTNRI